MASIAQLVSEFAHTLGEPNNKPLRQHIKLIVAQTRNEVIRRSFENHGYVDRVLTQRYKVSLTEVNDGEIELPEGYEAHVVPRSSTFKKWGIIETNSMGIIDESYKGDNDQWFFPAYALRDTKIEKNDRICQFRIVKKMETVDFETVEVLGNKDRGGHGSTGTK